MSKGKEIVVNNFAEKARENAKVIEAEIELISSGHWNFFERQYKDVWIHARQISHLFKTLKPLEIYDRERLWERFNLLCVEVKNQQQTEHNNRIVKSNLHRENIIREAERARPCTLFGFDLPDVREMRALGVILRNAGSMLSRHKQEMLGEHKQECFDTIKDVRYVHDLWWEELTRHRSKRHEEFQARVRNNLEKNYERHRKAVDALRRMRNNADDLREKIDTAWNDDYKDRAREWLSETEDRINDVENSIRQIEDWIQEDETKLR